VLEGFAVAVSVTTMDVDAPAVVLVILVESATDVDGAVLVDAVVGVLDGEEVRKLEVERDV